MKRKPTRLERTLTRQLDEAMDINRNMAEVATAKRVQVENLRVQIGNTMIENADLKRQIESLKEANDHIAGRHAAIEQSHRKQCRKLFSIIFDLQIELAHAQGYIIRVTDLDPPEARSGVSAERTTDIDDMLSLRDQLAGAETETMRDRILDSVDTETLDRVLGRGANDDRFIYSE
jgi:hypothetical protein